MIINNTTTLLNYVSREQLIDGLRKGDKNAIETAISILNDMPVTKIPDGYHYDTETATMLVYRHKYTGDEIHIRKPIQLQLTDNESLYSYFIAAIVKGFDGKHYEEYYATDNASGGYPYMSLCINNSEVRRFDTFDEAKIFLKHAYQFKENKWQFDGCDSNDLIDGPYIVKLECKKVNL